MSVIKPPTDLDPYEEWTSSVECVESAMDWLTDGDNLLDAYLGSAHAAAAFEIWCADTAAEGNAERRRLAGA